MMPSFAWTYTGSASGPPPRMRRAELAGALPYGTILGLTMENIRIAAAQFENRSGDKDYNLGVINALARRAANAGAAAVAFHECSVTGYSFARKLSREQMLDLAEPIPGGRSTRALIDIAATNSITVLAGLFEKNDRGELYKAQVCVDKTGLKAKFRKLHPFINPNLLPGNDSSAGLRQRVYAVFSNPIGMDDDQLKNGCSMIVDPFGDILSECRSFDDEVAVATCAREKLKESGGFRYRNARRPDLYRDIIGMDHQPEQKVVWMDAKGKSASG
jgi:predicted amidohydrolase